MIQQCGTEARTDRDRCRMGIWVDECWMYAWMSGCWMVVEGMDGCWMGRWRWWRCVAWLSRFLGGWSWMDGWADSWMLVGWWIIITTVLWWMFSSVGQKCMFDSVTSRLVSWSVNKVTFQTVLESISRTLLGFTSASRKSFTSSALWRLQPPFPVLHQPGCCLTDSSACWDPLIHQSGSKNHQKKSRHLREVTRLTLQKHRTEDHVSVEIFNVNVISIVT